MKTEMSLSDLEEAVKQQTKRKRIETAILGSVSFAGFLTAAVMAPNAIQVLHKVMPDFRPVSQKQSVKKAINRMIQHGYLKKENNRYIITKKGTVHLAKLTTNTRNLRAKKKWDGKWRLVIFDIPEKYKSKRELLRRYLIDSGFVKIQNSVWVYPFQCDEIVALLKFEIRLGRSTLYMIVDAIENDEWLRDYFGLKKEN